MSVMYLAGRSATIEFLRQGQLDPARPWRVENLAATNRGSLSEEDLAAPSGDGEKKLLSQIAPKWQAWYNAIFLLGGATALQHRLALFRPRPERRVLHRAVESGELVLYFGALKGTP